MTDTAALRAKLHDLAVAYQRAWKDYNLSNTVENFRAIEAAQRELTAALIMATENPAALVEIFAPGADGWLPIESAPKDGEVLQLWTGHYQHTGIYLESTQAWHALADDVELVPVPVLWRPLPAPPALQENPDAR